jgi:hypothetical protein
MKNWMKAGFRMMVGSAALAGLTGTALANNVAARVEGSLLVIAGDNVANQIVVARNAAGDVVVTGQNGTRVNGVASARFPRLALNAAEMQLGGGNDVVTLRGLQIANDLFLNLGDGADRLTIPAAASVTVGGSLAIEGAGGNDTIRTEGVIVGQDLYIDGGIGVLNATVSGAVVGFNVSLIGDDANDVITVSSLAAGGDIFVEAKGGSDRVSLTTVEALLIGISADANAIVGADRVTLIEVSTMEDLGIFTGPGNDIVQLMDVASAKNLTVSLDSENDKVSGMNVSAALDAVFEGGAGSDTFEDFGITGGTKKDVKEFEVLLP